MANSPLYKPRDPDLANLEQAISDLPNEVLPVTAPKLRAHSIGTLAEARKTRGSSDGSRGPRAMMLAGHLAPLDAGAGIFIWDSTSTLADDATATPNVNNVIAVQGTEPGRWRRLSLGGSGGVTDGDKGDVVVSVGGTVWLIDAAYTAAVLAAAIAAAPVQSVTAGAGLVNSGTASNPIVDAAAANATIVVNADSLQVGVISSLNVDTSIALTADVAPEPDLLDLERRFRLFLKGYFIQFQQIPLGLEDEVQFALQTE